MAKTKVLVCTKGKSCKKRGSKKVFCALARQLENFGLGDLVSLRKVDCLGLCDRGPAIEIKPDKVAIARVSPEDCKDIVKSLRKKKQAPERLGKQI